MRFAPTAIITISSAGTTTANGCTNRPPRLRSTIAAQSLACGEIPTPRKLAEATR